MAALVLNIVSLARLRPPATSLRAAIREAITCVAGGDCFVGDSSDSAALLAHALSAQRGRPRRNRYLAITGFRRWTFAYFGLLGIGFLCVEIPLIQAFILLVGRPTVAFAVVLFALLIASGFWAVSLRPRVPWLGGAAVLTVLIALYPTLMRALTNPILTLARPAR